MLMGSEKYIVCKGRQYLVGIPYEDLAYMRYSPSPYDAWKSKEFDKAIRIAKRIGGKVMKFNQLTGRTTGGWK